MASARPFGYNKPHTVQYPSVLVSFNTQNLKNCKPYIFTYENDITTTKTTPMDRNKISRNRHLEWKCSVFSIEVSDGF